MRRQNSRTVNASRNIVFSLVLQLVTAISGLFLPKIMIETYGSEVNGLIASITQFLSFISLLEAGVCGVIRASLYPKLANDDMDGVSKIIKASRSFFRNITIIFLFYVVMLCIFYPILVNNSFDAPYIVSMILILSISTLMQYYFGLTYYSLIAADQKIRIIHIIDVCAIIANFLLSYILVLLKVQVHVVKLIGCLVFAIKPLLYVLYVKKNYTLNMNIQADKHAISGKWNGMCHNIAFFVHSNIDIALLTLFAGPVYVSVYSIYYTISNGIQKVVMSVINGSSAGIGNLLASENKKSINRFFDKFEYLQLSASTLLFTTTAIMIIPFINIYTLNIKDFNYIHPTFAYIMVCSEMIYSFRCIYSTFYSAANRYKQTQKNAIVEAVVNVIISLLLVSKLKLVGIAIGTAVGMLIRLLMDMRYTSKMIERSALKSMTRFLIHILISLSCVFISVHLVPYNITQWWIWALIACVVCLLIAVIQIIAGLIFFREQINELYGMIKGKFFKR